MVFKLILIKIIKYKGAEMKKFKLAAIGCGGRALTYTSIAMNLPHRFEFVAAADPDKERLDAAEKISGNKNFKRFKTDTDILSQDKMADIMIIGTQDNYHYTPCKAAMEKGYDILLEKPIAQKPEEITELAQIAENLNRKVLVCHVLRYSPFYEKVKNILDSGVIGKIVSMNANEGVEPWHQAHSYVRGHWAVTEKSNPMILAKSCHDSDLISWILNRKCQSVSSFGSLTHFKSENAPEGAPERCSDGCPYENSCCYNALQYAGQHRAWLGYVYNNAEKADLQEIREWLSRSPWGRCVYHCDNTAVDHQTLNMEFEGGITSTFTMTAFEQGRHIEIYGTKGILKGGDFYKSSTGYDIITVDHLSKNESRINVNPKNLGGYSGHGGADTGLVLSLYDEMTKENPGEMSSSISKSIQSHMIGFAAEESRKSGKTVKIDDFIKGL